MSNVSTGGAWLPDEKLVHIKVLELKVILLALKSFVKTSHKHIKVMSENTTAIHCINKIGISQCHIQWNVITNFYKSGNGRLFTKITFQQVAGN